MPVHAYTIKAGTTSRLFLVHARTADAARAPKTGLSASTPGAGAAFARAGEPGAVEVPLSEGTVGTWTPGGFAEVDPDLMPGVYQVAAPDEMLAAGSTRAMLVLRFPGAAIDPVEVDLVAFDPQDSVRLGMTSLGPEARIEALRGAFPRLGAKEIEERTALLQKE